VAVYKGRILLESLLTRVQSDSTGVLTVLNGLGCFLLSKTRFSVTRTFFLLFVDFWIEIPLIIQS